MFTHVVPRAPGTMIMLFLVVTVISTSHGQTAMIRPSDLRCDFLSSPLGIDNVHPRLSWILESRRRGEHQTAYRILVASSAANLSRDQGDLWDTGKVPGDQTTLISYQGKSLVSHQRCFWKVMAWDRDGRPGSWSLPASWSVGILSTSEWSAEWIGDDAPRQNDAAVPFASARWIWFGGDKPGSVPPCRRYFVRVIDVPSAGDVTSADLAVTADDAFRLFLNGDEVLASSGGENSWKKPRRIDISSRLAAGRNVFFAEVENARQGDAGFLFWLRMKSRSAAVQTMVSDGAWVSSDSLFPEWKSTGPREGEGKNPVVIGNFGVSPWRLLDEGGLILPPPRYLTTRVTLRKKVDRAVLYVSALGICDFSLNGRRVSDDRFTPGWTDYAKRVYYRTYDVTKLLKKGGNTLAGVLADGWYSGHLGWGAVRDHYGAKTRLKALLHVEYADGTKQDFGTGPAWKASPGPLREADFLMGECYDARLADPAVQVTGGKQPPGRPVDVGAEVQPVLQSHPAQPVRAFAELTPLSVREPKPGVYVFDLGQNFAGVARLKVREREGQKVRLRFAERLNPDGTVYLENLRGARATDTYVCRGGGDEVWEPRFTFHGFQYVEVTGLSKKPAKGAVTGIALSSETPMVGEFECSEEMLNQLHRNILWTQRANFIDIPTDCPQRDERLGWTGDAQIYCRAASLNADVQAFFHKWLIDLDDAQRNDGQFPMVAPLKVAGGDGGPAWADAGVICPWTIYDVYGDTTILAAHYEAMRRFVDFCRNRSTPDLLPPAEFHCFGDWLNVDAETPKEVIFTAYFSRAAQLLSQAAEVLGKREDAGKYRALHEGIRSAFVRSYVGPDGKVRGETQTGYVLALAFGLLDEPASAQAARHLINDIERRGWHLSTGFIGTKDLMLVLARLDRRDVAYRLLLNTSFPSWGFTIKNGATSIWERWDGWTPEKGFQNPEMNSFAHYSFGAVYQWMVENIGGIRAEGPGYRNIIIAPEPGGTLRWGQTGYRSVRGWIRSSWRISRGKFVLTVEVPVNAEATVVLPGVGGPVEESGRPVLEQRGIRQVGNGGEGRQAFALGSGRYTFEYRYNRN
jgi:alpha-L-rhamnosidase